MNLMPPLKIYHGLFAGMATLDLVYLAAGTPSNNEKIVACDCTVAAGGPATNAAVTFSYLGDRAMLLAAVGTHPIAQLIRADLQPHGVAISDLDPTRCQPPPVSSIIVTQTTGERAVVSINATQSQISAENLPEAPLQNVDIVLIDGHQMAAGQVMAREAKLNNIPVVIDGGSWKPGFEEILPFVDYAVCSANFYPPGTRREEDVFAYLWAAGIPHIAITNGENPIQYLSAGDAGEVPVPQIKAVDTLGAGDVFHGAFCYYILRESFTQALASAAKVASRSCEFFGTRRWME